MDGSKRNIVLLGCLSVDLAGSFCEALVMENAARKTHYLLN